MDTRSKRLACAVVAALTLLGLASVCGCDELADLLNPSDIVTPPVTNPDPPPPPENIVYDGRYKVFTVLENLTYLPMDGMLGVTDDEVRIHGVNDAGQVLFSYVQIGADGKPAASRLMFYEGRASNTLVEFDTRKADGVTYDFAIMGEAGNFVWLGPGQNQPSVLHYGRISDRSYIDLSTRKVPAEQVGLNGIGHVVWAEQTSPYLAGPLKCFDGQYVYDLGVTGHRPRINNEGQLIWYEHGKGVIKAQLDWQCTVLDTQLLAAGRYDIYSLADDGTAVMKDLASFAIVACPLDTGERLTLYTGTVLTVPVAISRQGQFLLKDEAGNWQFYMTTKGTIAIGPANTSQSRAASNGLFAAFNGKADRNIRVFDGTTTFSLTEVGPEKLPTVAEDQYMLAVSDHGTAAWVEVLEQDRSADTARFRVRVGVPQP